MDRETLIRAVAAGAIVLAIMFGWKYIEPYIFPPPKPAAPAEKAPAKPAPEKAAAAAPAKGAAPAEKGATAPAPPAPAVTAPALKAAGAAETAAKPIVLGSAAYESDYDLEAEITPRGAAVRRLTLSRCRFFRTVADQHEPPDERAAMNLVDPSAPFAAFTIPELRVRLKGAEDWSPVPGLDRAAWNVESAGAGGAPAVLAIPIQDSDGRTVLTVRKTFRLLPRPKPEEPGAAPPPEYQVWVKLEFVPVGDSVEKIQYVIEGPPAMTAEAGRSMMPTAVAGTWKPGGVEAVQVPGKDVKKGDPLPPKQDLAAAQVAWAGQMDKYFAVVMIPQRPAGERQEAAVHAEAPPLEAAPSKETFAASAEVVWYEIPKGDQAELLPSVRLVSRELAVAPGQPLVSEVLVYAGPKDFDLLERYYGNLGLDKLIIWATPCCFIPVPGVDVLSRLLATLLDAFDKVVLNYGIAIIMLVVLLRAAMHPVTRWSTRSMMEMQKLGPKMQEIREKYADDKERMQQEMAKVGGFKTLTGCLPMFAQMPIWIALYGALGAAISLRHAAFIPAEWLPGGTPFSMFLQDLSAPDMLVHWKTPFFLPGRDIPIIGTYIISGLQSMLAGGAGGITSFNLLPVLVGGSMYLLQLVTPQPAAAGANPQAAQAKQMMLPMSIFMAVMLYGLPSGLCLYISASSFLGFFEQRYLKKKMGTGGPGGREEQEKSAPKSPPKPQPPAERKSMVSGRAKSLGEQVEAWLRNLMTPPEAKRGDDDRRGKGKRK